jgi:hypothetical protein
MQASFSTRASDAARLEVPPVLAVLTEPRRFQWWTRAVTSTSDGPARPLRSFSDRLSARRRRPHRPLQLALRPASRRRVRASHRGHRRGALVGGDGRGHSSRHALARPRLGRGAARRRPLRAVLPVRSPRPSPCDGGQARRAGKRVLLLLHARGAQGEARDDGAVGLRSDVLPPVAR